MWTASLRDNRRTRRAYKIKGQGLQQPIDLGIKQYKRLHGNEPKRVVYYKLEMWKAFHELKENTNGKERKQSPRKRASTT